MPTQEHYEELLSRIAKLEKTLEDFRKYKKAIMNIQEEIYKDVDIRNWLKYFCKNIKLKKIIEDTKNCGNWEQD